MTKSYTNSFEIGTIDTNGDFVSINNFADSNNTIDVSYRSFNKRVDVVFERAVDEVDEKQLTNIVIRLNNTPDTQIASIKPKFDISDLSWYGTGGVIGYVDTFPPVIDPENPEPGVDARTSFRLNNAAECIVLYVDADAGAESIQNISVTSFSVGYQKPYVNKSGRVHHIVNEVLNKGPNTAEGVEGDFVIGESLTVSSMETSKGAFDSETGEWVIGDLTVGEQAASVLKVTNTTEYEDVVSFVVGSDTEDPTEENTESVAVIPGEPVRPFVINQLTGEVTEGFTIAHDKTRPDNAEWGVLRAHRDGVCLLRRTIGGINRYLAFSSYRNGVEVLSEPFRIPSTVSIEDEDLEDPVSVPLVETMIGGIAVKNGFAATVVAGRYFLETTVEIDDPDAPIDPEDPEAVIPKITVPRTYERVETYHFKHETTSTGQSPVMTALATAGFNSMDRTNDVLEDPDYMVFAGSRIVYVPTGTTIAQGSNGMHATMTNGGSYNRIFYSGTNNVTQVRVSEGTVIGTDEIPYGDASGLKVIDFGTAGSVFTFGYEWISGGETNTSFKAFKLIPDEPYVEEIEISGFTEILYPYASLRFDEILGGIVMIGEGNSDEPNASFVHRVSVDADDIDIDGRVLFVDEVAIDDIFLKFPVGEVKDFISTPTII